MGTYFGCCQVGHGYIEFRSAVSKRRLHAVEG